jgi:hypothetical protein
MPKKPRKCIYAQFVESDLIKLLQLLPGRRGNEIQCWISHDRLSRPLGHEALSYTWGDSNVTDDTICNGCCLRVTTNLTAALRRLRFAAKSRRLWVDAICMYSYRTATKCCRNLRFRPQFCEGLVFVSESQAAEADRGTDIEPTGARGRRGLGARGSRS